MLLNRRAPGPSNTCTLCRGTGRRLHLAPITADHEPADYLQALRDELLAAAVAAEHEGDADRARTLRALWTEAKRRDMARLAGMEGGAA